jgi:membrane-associated phospholipid phosphatase
VLLLVIVVSAVIVTLMYAFDAEEISLMPPRGAPGLWWARILTDFGKDTHVLWALGLLLIAVALTAPALRGVSRATLLGLGTRLQYLFLAVAFSVAVGELIKWIVGRGRPFVGGKANAFNFQHFAGTEAYSSFPSGHSITAFALAFAVAAVWPRARIAMLVYALVIIATRLLLLAHHPSDVVAGALVGVIGAMAVRYWFAARRLGFAIHRDGAVVALSGPSEGRLKRVARSAFAP